MIVGIHQPNYIPWIGYFYKILKSDKFVILDDVQYIKNSFINRNRIKTPQGAAWLTLPVYFKGNFGDNINEIKLKNELGWKDKHLKTIEMNYKKSQYFDNYFNDLKNIYDKEHEFLSDLNTDLIFFFMDCLNIKTEVIKSSQLNILGTSTERLVNICKCLEADEYLSGTGGQNYQDEQFFKENNIKLTYSDFKHPVYQQLWGEFIPNLSILDFIFNYGDKCGDILNK